MTSHDPHGPADPLSPSRRQTVRLALLALAALGSGSLLGTAFWAWLVNHAPLLLIALSPLGRHLVLVAPIVDPVAFLLVAVTRRMLFYGASFTLGRALGPSGIVWIEARAARFGRFVRFLEALFSRAAHLVVLFLVGPTVSALAGTSGMRPAVFAGLATAGTLGRMLVILGLAEWLRDEIELALVWIDQYWVPLTVVTVLGVVTYRLRRRRREGSARRRSGTGQRAARSRGARSSGAWSS
jgi:membrane protein DedA with SNARE-associated domain